MPNILSYISFTPPPSPTEVLFETFYESLDGFLTQNLGSGLIDFIPGGIRLSSWGSPSSGAWLKKILDYHPLALSWLKKRSIVAKLSVSIEDTTSWENYLSAGDFMDPTLGFGFRFAPSGIKGWCSNGGSKNEITLIDYMMPPWAINAKFEAIFYPGEKVVFFINDVLKGQLTSELPTGDSLANYLLGLEVYSNGAATNIIQTSYARMIQWI